MTPSRIAELRALAGAATPGLWGLLDDARGTAVCAAHGSITICRFISPSRAALADARYIAAACNALPAALDEIERLRAALTRIHDEWPRCRAHLSHHNERAGALVCETCGERWSERALDVIDAALEGSE